MLRTGITARRLGIVYYNIIIYIFDVREQSGQCCTRVL